LAGDRGGSSATEISRESASSGFEEPTGSACDECSTFDSIEWGATSETGAGRCFPGKSDSAPFAMEEASSGDGVAGTAGVPAVDGKVEERGSLVASPRSGRGGGFPSASEATDEGSFETGSPLASAESLDDIFSLCSDGNPVAESLGTFGLEDSATVSPS
jgi:hypothetical protein